MIHTSDGLLMIHPRYGLSLPESQIPGILFFSFLHPASLDLRGRAKRQGLLDSQVITEVGSSMWNETQLLSPPTSNTVSAAAVQYLLPNLHARRATTKGMQTYACRPVAWSVLLGGTHHKHHRCPKPGPFGHRTGFSPSVS